MRQTERPGRIFAIDGQQFDFKDGDAESKAKAEARKDKYNRELIERRQKLAGRELTEKELERGLQRNDDRSLREKMADDRWKPTKGVEQTDDPNPFRRAMANGLHLPQRKETKAELYERSAKEWDEQRAAEAAQVEFDSNPKRKRAVELAEASLEAVLFDPDYKTSDVVKATQRVRQAKEGDLSVFKGMHDEFVADRKARADARIGDVDAQLAELRAHKAELIDSGFDL